MVVLDSIPAGWKVLQGAISHPHGMRWINNGKSRFGSDYQNAVVPDEVME